VTDPNVFQLSQPGSFADPLTEVLRNGARALLAQVRGFLTAVVRTKLGLTLDSEKTGQERVYRIVANDVSPKRKARPGRNAA
jgi:hypothetical protein